MWVEQKGGGTEFLQRRQYFAPREVVEGEIRGLQFLNQLWNVVKKNCNEAEISNLTDWSIFILVDCNDKLRILHSCKVLNCPRNADGDIQAWSDDFSGLANLQIIGGKARIDHRTGCSDSRS